MKSAESTLIYICQNKGESLLFRSACNLIFVKSEIVNMPGDIYRVWLRLKFDLSVKLYSQTFTKCNITLKNETLAF